MSDNAPLLTYEISSNPAIIHASPKSGSDSVISLSIKVTNKTNPHQAIDCASIKIDFNKGVEAANLFRHEEGITVGGTGEWMFSRQSSSFTATPNNAAARRLTNPLLFELGNIKVNAQPGIAQFTITEETGGVKRSKTITVAKFPSDQDTLLTYGLEPESVEISPATGDPSLADISVSVTNLLDVPVDCTSIDFNFLQGVGAAHLFTDATGIETDVDSRWDILKSSGRFTATPKTSKDGRIVRRGVLFEFKKIKVNNQVGTTRVTITEVTNVDVNNTGRVVTGLRKTPVTLQIDDFRASPAIIDEKGATTLSWSGTGGAIYSIEYLNADGVRSIIEHPKGSLTKPLPASGSYTIEKLETATTFRLYASLAGQKLKHKEFRVDVKPAPPGIKLFAGELTPRTEGSRLTLKWDTEHADYCKLSGNDSKLDSKADAHRIELTSEDPPTKEFTLTAFDKDKRHSAGTELTVNWRMEELWAVATNLMLTGVAVAPDNGRVFAVGFEKTNDTIKGSLLVLHPRNLERIGEPIPLEHFPNSVAVSADQRRIYAMADLSLWALEANTRQRIGDVISPEILGSLVAVSSANTPVAVIGLAATADKQNLTGAVRKIDPVSLRPTGDVFLLDKVVTSVAVSPVNQQLFLGCHDKTIRAFDATTQRFVGNPIQVAAVPKGIAFSPDAKIIYMVGDDNNLTALIAATGVAFKESVPLGAIPTGLAISPDGEHLYVTTFDGKLRRFAAYAIFSPVRIGHFTATPSQFDVGDDNNSYPVTLDWSTIRASQVLLNNEPTTATNKSVSIDKTTKFTIEARGGGGPIFSRLTVPVIRPVKIDRFTVSDSDVTRGGQEIEVRFDWATRNATGLRLNGQPVDGTSRVMKVIGSGAMQFTLEATGKNGPVSAHASMVVRDVNLQVTRDGDTIRVSFTGDAGTYQIKFVAGYMVWGGLVAVLPRPGTVEYSTVATSQGGGQIVTVNQTVQGLSGGTGKVYTFVDVTVTGFPRPITYRLSLL